MKVTNIFQSFCLLMFVLFLGACERSTETSDKGTTEPVTTVSPDQEDQRLAAYFEELFERDVSQNPEFQAYLGRKTEDYGRWDDYSDEYAQIQNLQTVTEL